MFMYHQQIYREFFVQKIIFNKVTKVFFNKNDINESRREEEKKKRKFELIYYHSRHPN